MTGIFQRKEIKYLIDARQREAIEKVLPQYMIEDEHGESTIRNIYFDTITGMLIRRSSEKPVYKEKLRMRSYCTKAADDRSFLELKKKYKGIVYKRRIEVREKEFYEYLEGKRSFPEEGQIAKEIDYFCRFYKDLSPRMYLSYDRCAYFGKDDPDLRITFDRNIMWRTEDLSLSEEPGGFQLLDEGMSLMELKVANAMPLWLVDVLNKNEMKKTSFSKYGTAYKEFIDLRGSIKYA